MTNAREAASTETEVWPHLGGSFEQTHVLSARIGEGVLLGATRAGKPVSLSLIRPAPVRIVVVGQGWVASLLALRAAALGATTVIVTSRPAPWTVLVRVVGGTIPFASVVGPDGLSLPTPTVAEPLFVLQDGSTGSTDPGIARSAWHTSVHLLYRLTPAASSLVDTADLILVPRPSEQDLSTTLDFLRLPPGIAAQMARMAPQELLAVTRSKATFLTVQPTASETAVLT